MAGNVKKVIVLDFFGLPGCGKSMVSHILAETLRKKGYSVYEPSYVYDHGFGVVRRKLWKFWKYVCFSACHLVKSTNIYFWVKENGYKTFLECLSQCVNIVSKYVAVNKKSFDYIVFDEGFCQAAISLSCNKESRKDVISNYKKICKIYGDALDLRPVYLKAEVETALENIKKRGGRDSRVDAETDDTKRHEMMCDFDKLCDCMSDLAFITQTTKNNGRLTADSILKKLLNDRIAM